MKRTILILVALIATAPASQAAGPIRNGTMAHYADAVALFPGGRGTEDMARQSEQKGLEIFDYRQPSDAPVV